MLRAHLVLSSGCQLLNGSWLKTAGHFAVPARRRPAGLDICYCLTAKLYAVVDRSPSVVFWK